MSSSQPPVGTGTPTAGGPVEPLVSVKSANVVASSSRATNTTTATSSTEDHRHSSSLNSVDSLVGSNTPHAMSLQQAVDLEQQAEKLQAQAAAMQQQAAEVRAQQQKAEREMKKRRSSTSSNGDSSGANATSGVVVGSGTPSSSTALPPSNVLDSVSGGGGSNSNNVLGSAANAGGGSSSGNNNSSSNNPSSMITGEPVESSHSKHRSSSTGSGVGSPDRELNKSERRRRRGDMTEDPSVGNNSKSKSSSSQDKRPPISATDEKIISELKNGLPPAVSTSLKDFRQMALLGEGAYSAVYKILRLSDNKIYALKKVKLPNLSEKEKQNSLNEVRLLASIQHENVIGYKESFYDDASRCLCIITEYADGGDLFQKISHHQKMRTFFREADVWHCTFGMCHGLKALHELKILHRDLKCANVFLGSKGEVKLGDLNVSKVAKRGLCMTQTGTPYYASPEVWRDMPYDAKSDMWSLGCVIYEMVALRPPFRADDMESLYRKILRGQYPRVPSVYSRDVNEVIALLLQVNPRQRPAVDVLLQLPVMQRHIHYDSASRKGGPRNVPTDLLNTIKMPKDANMSEVAGQMPRPRYEDPIPEEPSQEERYRRSRQSRRPKDSLDQLRYNLQQQSQQPQPQQDLPVVPDYLNQGPYQMNPQGPYRHLGTPSGGHAVSSSRRQEVPHSGTDERDRETREHRNRSGAVMLTPLGADQQDRARKVDNNTPGFGSYNGDPQVSADQQRQLLNSRQGNDALVRQAGGEYRPASSQVRANNETPSRDHPREPPKTNLPVYVQEYAEGARERNNGNSNRPGRPPAMPSAVDPGAVMAQQRQLLNQQQLNGNRPGTSSQRPGSNSGPRPPPNYAEMVAVAAGNNYERRMRRDHELRGEQAGGSSAASRRVDYSQEPSSSSNARAQTPDNYAAQQQQRQQAERSSSSSKPPPDNIVGPERRVRSREELEVARQELELRRAQRDRERMGLGTPGPSGAATGNNNDAYNQQQNVRSRGSSQQQHHGERAQTPSSSSKQPPVDHYPLPGENESRGYFEGVDGYHVQERHRRNQSRDANNNSRQQQVGTPYNDPNTYQSPYAQQLQTPPGSRGGPQITPAQQYRNYERNYNDVKRQGPSGSVQYQASGSGVAKRYPHNLPALANMKVPNNGYDHRPNNKVPVYEKVHQSGGRYQISSSRRALPGTKQPPSNYHRPGQLAPMRVF